MHRNNIRIALVYTGTLLVLATLVWIPFSYSGDFSKIWITGLILAAGGLWTLKQIKHENRETKFLSMAVRKLKASAVSTLILAIFLIFSSFSRSVLDNRCRVNGF